MKLWRRTTRLTPTGQTVVCCGEHFPPDRRGDSRRRPAEQRCKARSPAGSEARPENPARAELNSTCQSGAAQSERAHLPRCSGLAPCVCTAPDHPDWCAQVVETNPRIGTFGNGACSWLFHRHRDGLGTVHIRLLGNLNRELALVTTGMH